MSPEQARRATVQYLVDKGAKRTAATAAECEFAAHRQTLTIRVPDKTSSVAKETIRGAATRATDYDEIQIEGGRR